MTGAQTAHRTLDLLRRIGERHLEGAKLAELLEATGLQRSTAHRLIACLVQEGFVERDAEARRYRLGVEAMQLGFAWGGGAPLIQRCTPAMQRIARLTGDTVFLIVRSGDSALCLHREEGAYPIKAFVVDAGMRRLLGMSAVGVAMLAQMPDAEIESVYLRSAAEYRRSGVSREMLRDLVKAARRQGFSETTDWRTRETSGVGCAFLVSSHARIGVSVAAVNSRMTAARRAEIGALIQAETRELHWGRAKASPALAEARG